MPIPIWAGHYIGLNFAEYGRSHSGLDCWGLVRLVLSEQFGLALPSFNQRYASTTDRQSVSRLIKTETENWSPVTPGEEDLGDVVVLRIRGEPMHIGIVLGDDQMLHIERGVNSVLERYDSPRWQARIFGFYRYNPFLQDKDGFTTFI